MSTRYKILFLLCAVTYLISPLTSVKAETLKDYKNLLEKYENEQKANQAEINKTEGAIASSKAQIESIKREIQNMTEEVQKMEEEVIESDNLIKEKSLETPVVISKNSTSFLTLTPFPKTHFPPLQIPVK